MAQLVGFNLKKIKAEKESELSDLKGKLEIKSNINITNIKKEDIEISKDKEILGFYFQFDISFNPKVAIISFEGLVLLMTDAKEAKEILKDWKKKKTREDLKLLIYNQILLKCSIKALEFEEELNIPFHFPMPKFTHQQSQQANQQQGRNYTG